MATLVKTKSAGFAVEHVAGWKRERHRLFVYLVGGRFLDFTGMDADSVEDMLRLGAVDLENDRAIESQVGMRA